MAFVATSLQHRDQSVAMVSELASPGRPLAAGRGNDPLLNLRRPFSPKVLLLFYFQGSFYVETDFTETELKKQRGSRLNTFFLVRVCACVRELEI